MIMTGDNENGIPEVVKVDALTNDLVVITQDHHGIHQKIAFTVTHKFVNIASEGTAFLYFVTPAIASGLVHFKPSLLTSDGPNVDVEMYEGGTVAANGTGLTPVNRHRYNPVASAMVSTFFHTPTTPNPTLKIDSDFLGGGTGVGISKTGAGAIVENELVLNPGTKYFIKVTNNGAATVNVHLKLFWYEEAY